jgi:hypothetical protein
VNVRWRVFILCIYFGTCTVFIIDDGACFFTFSSYQFRETVPLNNGAGL